MVKLFMYSLHVYKVVDHSRPVLIILFGSRLILVFLSCFSIKHYTFYIMISDFIASNVKQDKYKMLILEKYTFSLI